MYPRSTTCFVDEGLQSYCHYKNFLSLVTPQRAFMNGKHYAEFKIDDIPLRPPFVRC